MIAFPYISVDINVPRYRSGLNDAKPMIEADVSENVTPRKAREAARSIGV